MTDPDTTLASLRYTNGTFEAIPDVLGGDQDGWDAALTQRHWESCFTFGTDMLGIQVCVWRQAEQWPTPYLVQYRDFDTSSPFILVNWFPDLMDLLARWAPAIQAAALADLAQQVTSRELNIGDLVERVAARAAYGADHHQEILSRQERDEREARRRRQAQREQLKPPAPPTTT